MVCDIVVKNTHYSTLHKKLLTENMFSSDDDVVIMIDNKFYVMGCESFRELAKELIENQTKDLV